MSTAAARRTLIASSASPRAERALALARTGVLVYLVLGTPILAVDAMESGSGWPLAVHMLAMAAGVALHRATSEQLFMLRDWMTPLFAPFLYLELRWLVAAAGRPHADAIIMQWERLIFPSDPSRTLALHLPSVALSEIVHVAYASYYLILAGPLALLYVRGRRDAFGKTILALTITFLICFTAFVLFPVDGPRYLRGAALAPEGPARTIVLALLESGSSRGTAFPSSHVAASVAATLCALRLQRATGFVMVPATAALTIGTVYGGFHYGVDALAGLVLGAVTCIAGAVLWRALPDDEGTATAA